MRGAFFQLVCALCEFTPELVVAQATLLCPAVLLNIDDTDPAVLPSVWEAVLHVVSTVPVSMHLQLYRCHGFYSQFKRVNAILQSSDLIVREF